MNDHARRPRAVALAAAALLAGALAAAVPAAVAQAHTQAPVRVGSAAIGGSVPAPPPGWTRVFADNFSGRAGSAPATANWFYDIGTNYGTGELEQTTSSTRNVYLDGHGDLVLRAIRTGGRWTSARIESTRDGFAAPAGGELELTASIRQPDPADGLGYWPAFWALGSPMRAGGGWPQSGEIDMMEDVNGLNEASQTLHDAAGSSGHPLIACPARGSRCQTGYHTYSVIINRAHPSAESLQFVMDGRVESTITEAAVGPAAWADAVDHGFFIIFDLAMGGNYPDGECGCTAPAAATTSGASMSVGYVAVDQKGSSGTHVAAPTATGAITGVRGRCLTNHDSLNTEGNPMFATACDGRAGQRWSVNDNGSVRTEGGCLDVTGAGTTSGTTVDWYPCNRTGAQVWDHHADGELVNPSSGLCLTDPGGDAATRLDIQACADSAQQRWTLPRRAGA
jgi:beta-glucanase (GH16 family)